MELQQIRAGLWRWTAVHPDAEADPEPGSPAGWPPEVGCVAYAAPDALVLIDPLVPRDGWPALDALAAGKQVATLMTLRLHGRSSEAVIDRYGASTDVPAGVEPMEIARADETMFWIPEHRALVPGDRLVSFGGGLRPCPDSWLGYLKNGLVAEALRGELRKLLELPIELVLVSHGEPVLEGGRDALAAALYSR